MLEPKSVSGETGQLSAAFQAIDFITKNPCRVLNIASTMVADYYKAADILIRHAKIGNSDLRLNCDFGWMDGIDRTQPTVQNALGLLQNKDAALYYRLAWFFRPEDVSSVRLVNLWNEQSELIGDPVAEKRHDALLSSIIWLAFYDAGFQQEDRWGLAMAALKSLFTDEAMWSALSQRQVVGPEARQAAVAQLHQSILKIFNNPASGKATAGGSLDSAFHRHAVLRKTAFPPDTPLGKYCNGLLVQIGATAESLLGRHTEKLSKFQDGYEDHLQAAKEFYNDYKKTVEPVIEHISQVAGGQAIQVALLKKQLVNPLFRAGKAFMRFSYYNSSLQAFEKCLEYCDADTRREVQLWIDKVKVAREGESSGKSAYTDKIEKESGRHFERTRQSYRPANSGQSSWWIWLIIFALIVIVRGCFMQ